MNTQGEYTSGKGQKENGYDRLLCLQRDPYCSVQ